MAHAARVLVSTLVVPLALTTATPRGAAGQDLGDAILDVLEWLNEGYQLVPESGQWGLVFGWFAEGEEKEIVFTTTKGQAYMIAGGGDASSEDLDICVYDAQGAEVRCDVLTDNYPLVEFTAEMSGEYRAVLNAYALKELTSYAGMVILRKN